MKYHAAPSFWEAYNALDPEVRKVADKSFEILKNDRHHSSIRLKKTGRFWSVPDADSEIRKAQGTITITFVRMGSPGATSSNGTSDNDTFTSTV